MSHIKQCLLDTIDSQQEEIDVDSDVQMVYYIPSSVEIKPPSRSELMED